MAAYGHGEELGLQIFVTVRKGSEWPPRTTDIRVRYEETVGDIKEKASSALGIPKENLQLFRHKKELTAAYDNKTLLELEIHTGFGLQGWDTRETPNYWPPVKQTPEGLVLQC